MNNNNKWMDEFDEILHGIDMDEVDGGWWPTSKGEEFGAKVKASLKAFISKQIKEAEERMLREVIDFMLKLIADTGAGVNTATELKHMHRHLSKLNKDA